MRRKIAHPVTSPGVTLRTQEIVFLKTRFAPDLSTESIEQSLLELGFLTRDIRPLYEHTEFPAIPFKLNQSCHFHEYASDVLNDPTSMKEFTTLFKMNERTVRHNLLQGPHEPGPLDCLHDSMHNRKQHWSRCFWTPFTLDS
jgi:hypothetical protein